MSNPPYGYQPNQGYPGQGGYANQDPYGRPQQSYGQPAQAGSDADLSRPGDEQRYPYGLPPEVVAQRRAEAGQGVPPSQPSAGYAGGQPYSSETPYGSRSAGAPYAQPMGQQPYSQPSAQAPYSQPSAQAPYSQPSAQQPYSQPSAQQPYSQPSAQQPYSQPSAQASYSQPSAQAPYSQPSAQAPYSQPSAPYGQPGAEAPHYGQQVFVPDTSGSGVSGGQPQAPYGQNSQGYASPQTPYGQPYGQQPQIAVPEPSGPSAYSQAAEQSPYGQPADRQAPQQPSAEPENDDHAAEPADQDDRTPAAGTQPYPTYGSQPQPVPSPTQAGQTNLQPRDDRPADAGWTAELDDGRTIEITKLTLLGRNPQPRAGEDAALVTITDESRKISKTHLALGVDDRGLYLCDRGSTNGTAIENAPDDFRPCPEGEMVRLGEGQKISYGDRSFVIRRQA